jgi:hypothetical protein
MLKVTKLALYFSIVLAFLFTSSANAQKYYEDDYRTFFGGLLLGTNFSQIDGDNYAGYNKTGLNVGGIMYARLNTDLAMSMELLFSQKGSNGKNPILSTDGNFSIYDYKIKLNYAEIPVMLNYFDRRKSHFGAGFSYSQLVSSNETFQSDKIYPVPFKDFSSVYPFKKMDVNFLLSGNLHLAKGFFLNIRFQYSLFPIRTELPPGLSRREQFSNMWVMRLMYLF